MAADINLVKKVFSDEEFVVKLAALSDPAEIQAALKEKGIDLSIEEINEIGESIKTKIGENPGGELSLDQLDEVAGGMGIIATVVITVICALCGAAGFLW